MNVFDLFAKISLDTSEYEGQLDDASGKTHNFGEKLKNGLASAAKVGAAAIGTATAAVGAFAKIGLDYNSQMEQYTTNFTTMLGSQEAAVQKVEELKKFAASTPLSMSDLAQGTQTLLAFGVASENSTSILRQLGDIALGDADKMQRLSTAFGKATAQGKVTGDTVQQMIDAGFNPLIQISKAAGETMEETQKRMSDGAISVAELEAAMEAVTSGTGQFAGGMEAASHTTEGLISTLKDNAAAKLGEAFQSVSDILKEELLPRALEFVDSLDVEAIVSGVQSATDAFINFSPVIAAATAAMVAYKAASAISGVIDALTKATEAQSIAQAALNAVMNANPFVLVATLIAAVGTALVTLYATNEDFRNKVQEIWENIKEVFSGAWGAIKIVWDVVPGYFENVWNTIKGIFSVVESILSGDFEGAWEAIKNVLSGWGEYFEGLWKTVKNIFFGVKDWFFDVGKDILTGIWNGITDKVEWLKGKVSGVVDTIKGWFTGKEGFDEHSPSRWAKEVGAFISEGLANGIDEKADDVQKSAEKIAKNTYSTLKEWADRQTKFQKLSLREQLDLWRTIQDQFIKESKQYADAEEKIFDLKAKLQDEYYKKVEETNKKISDLESNYYDTLRKRESEIANAYGLFSAVEKREEVTGEDLLHNLQDQVSVMKSFYNGLEELYERGISKSIVDEIREMGPSAEGELHALLNLTDRQLDQYANIYLEKQQLANRVALDELKDLKYDTISQVSENVRVLMDYYEQNAPELGLAFTDGFADGIYSGMVNVQEASFNVAQAAIQAANSGVSSGITSRTAEAIKNTAYIDQSESSLVRFANTAGAKIFNSTMQPINLVAKVIMDNKVVGEASYEYLHNRERAYGGAY